MIIGLSHVTLRCSNISESIEKLTSAGYKLDFIEEEVENSGVKRQFLRGWSERMQIALLRSESGLPIELVSYPWDWQNTISTVEPIWSTGDVPSGNEQELTCSGATKDLLLDVFSCERVVRIPHPHFKVPFWYLHRGSAAGLQGLVQRVPSVRAAMAFWTKLNLKCELTPLQRCTLGVCTFRSVLRSFGLKLILVEDPVTVSASYLDGAGISLVAFVCSNLSRDRLLINADAIPSTGIFSLCVNNNRLKLELLSVFPGLFVELLERRSRAET